MAKRLSKITSREYYQHTSKVAIVSCRLATELEYFTQRPFVKRARQEIDQRHPVMGTLVACAVQNRRIGSPEKKKKRLNLRVGDGSGVVAMPG